MPSKHLPVGSVREPIIRPVRLTELRPTQMTVGMREVEERRQHWRSLASGKKRDAFLQTHLIPVILGADDRHYIVDHHHLVVALHREGLEEMYVTVMADLSGLDKKTFWFVLDQRNWMHPFDAKGERRSYEDIPKRVDRMLDDPFRAGRRAAPPGWLRQGHDALQRVSLGQFPAQPSQAGGCAEGFCACTASCAEASEEKECRLSTRLVRAEFRVRLTAKTTSRENLATVLSGF